MEWILVRIQNWGDLKLNFYIFLNVVGFVVIHLWLPQEVALQSTDSLLYKYDFDNDQSLIEIIYIKRPILFGYLLRCCSSDIALEWYQ